MRLLLPSFSFRPDDQGRRGAWAALMILPGFVSTSWCAGIGVPVPTPAGSVAFGTSVVVLPNGNFVVTDPEFAISKPETSPYPSKVGAVYLYDGATLGIISVLTGSFGRNDQVGVGGIVVLENGNFLVKSPYWYSSSPAEGTIAGAVTWGSAVSGVSGEVSAANSLTDTGSEAQLPGITPLGNGNYLLMNPNWNQRRGAVTWGNGSQAVTGRVSAKNSLVGSATHDAVGSTLPENLTLLSNGNFLICSPDWGQGRGAVTWGSGAAGVSGEISTANSLTGSSTGDRVGQPGDNSMPAVTPLSNGNFVITSFYWKQDRGAVTWGSGASGVKGGISAANSLVGTRASDFVARPFSTMYVRGVVPLANGNYVVHSPGWNAGQGSVTWGNGTSGTAGEISPGNSLIGTTTIGDGWKEEAKITILANGGYVVVSTPGSDRRGAVTWGHGNTGVSGEISTANSLIGVGSEAIGSGGVTPLTNGNFVVSSPGWGKGQYLSRGAVTWVNGNTGITGTISEFNSLVGAREGAVIGGGLYPAGVTALTNGNFVVCSPDWEPETGDGLGAVTWGDGSHGITGMVTAANSLVGSANSDRVGFTGVKPLRNGNYLVCSPQWNAGKGALTWASGAQATTGAVSEGNSLVGSQYNDLENVNPVAVTELKNGNYLVFSPRWNDYRGAVTWGNGRMGVTGAISAENSIVGTGSYEGVGYYAADLTSAQFQPFTELANGNYVLCFPYWNGSRGAATWGNGTSGAAGEISSANSLVSSIVNNYTAQINGSPGLMQIIPLRNGNYVVHNPFWNGRNGATTWGSGTAGRAGEISSDNSLTGTTARVNASYVAPHIISISDGIYAVLSNWMARGAITAGDGTPGTTGAISAANSFLGPSDIGWKYLSSYDAVRNRLLAGSGQGNSVVLIPLAPVMKVEGQSGVDVLDESMPAAARRTDFGNAAVNGGSRTYDYNLFDIGGLRLQLTGTPKVEVAGANAGDFKVTKQPEAFGGTENRVSFEVRFDPTEAGLRTATIRIRNNATADGGNHPFEFTLRGTGLASAAFAAWSAEYFGDEVSNTAPSEDFDRDGVPNLLEFAFGTLPHLAASGPAPLKYSGLPSGNGSITSVGGPATLRDGDRFFALFVRRKDAAAAGLTYVSQFSSNLRDWQTTAAEPVVLAEDGTNQIVSVPYPSAGEETKATFFRLAVILVP